MKLLLLQDHIYLPTFGGGIKANRLLLESLAEAGHQCSVLCPAFTTRAGPKDAAEFQYEMARRGVQVSTPEPFVFSYWYKGVSVESFFFPAQEQSRNYITRRVREHNPDRVFVNDDKRRLFLQCAIATVPGRVILLLQTIVNLPFGPLAAQPDSAQLELMRQASAVVVISSFLQDYLLRYAGLASVQILFPVYGKGPFPMYGRFDEGYITLINPCVEKGLEIFLALASEFSTVPFAVVPTWGADAALVESLRRIPNMTILEAVDDIDQIYARTRVLLVPSLWPETFGYVVPEAMLRGIPVLASNIGGLAEAKLGVDYLLPVLPAERNNGVYTSPVQNIVPWSNALRELLNDRKHYKELAAQSRRAALAFHSTISVSPFEELAEA